MSVIDTVTSLKPKHRAWLFNRNCKAEYHIKLDTSLITKFGAPIRTTVKQILQAWNTKLGYALFVHDWNGDNVISYGPYHKSALMITRHKPEVYSTKVYSPSRADTALFNSGFDITVYGYTATGITSWNTSLTGSLSANEYDFYKTLLHELGHGLGLNHCINFERGKPWYPNMEVLHGSSGPGQSPRITLNSNTGETAAGGADVVAQSKAANLKWDIPANALYAKLGAPTTLTATIINMPNDQRICNYGNTGRAEVQLTTNPIDTAISGKFYRWKYQKTFYPWLTAVNDTLFSGQYTNTLIVKNRNYTTNHNMLVHCEAYGNGCMATSSDAQFKISENVLLKPIPSQCWNPAGTDKFVRIANLKPDLSFLEGNNVMTPNTIISGLDSLGGGYYYLKKWKLRTSGTYKITQKAVLNFCPVTVDSTWISVINNCSTLAANTHKIYINEVYKNSMTNNTWFTNGGTNDPCKSMKLWFTVLGNVITGDVIKIKLSTNTGVLNTNNSQGIIGTYTVSAAATNLSDSILLGGISTFTATADINYKMSIFLNHGTTTEWGEVSPQTFSFSAAPPIACPPDIGNRFTNTSNTIENVRLYPNPTNNHFTLEIPTYEESTSEITITDTQGRIINTHFTTETINEIETTDLPAGLYFVQVRQGMAHTILKLVIIK